MDINNYLDSSIIFSIPIYFRSKQKHDLYFEQKEQKYFQYRENLHKENEFISTHEDRIKWSVEFNRNQYYPWYYNEIIGYIEIRKNRNLVYLFVILINADRFTPNRTKKVFEISEDFPDFIIDIENKTNSQITNEIDKNLYSINNFSNRMKNLFIDRTIYDRIVKYIDFK